MPPRGGKSRKKLGLACLGPSRPTSQTRPSQLAIPSFFLLFPLSMLLSLSTPTPMTISKCFYIHYSKSYTSCSTPYFVKCITTWMPILLSVHMQNITNYAMSHVLCMFVMSLPMSMKISNCACKCLSACCLRKLRKVYYHMPQHCR